MENIDVSHFRLQALIYSLKICLCMDTGNVCIDKPYLSSHAIYQYDGYGLLFSASFFYPFIR